MAAYNAIITNAGRTLFRNAAIGGGVVTPVRVSTGDGTLGATDPATLSALIHQVQDFSISSSNALVPYQSTFQFLIDSSQVSSTYALREVGLYAALGAGSPVLIYYSWTTSPPDTITPGSGSSATLDFNSLTITFSNTPNTTATLTPTVPPALHAITHLQRTDGSSPDPIPIATTSDVGFVPKTPNDAIKVLVGTATASWASVPRIIGEIIDFAGPTPPAGWLLCDGASYPTTGIYAALFAVISYNYGGSGAAFSVPDCRGRTSVGAGQGPGLLNRALASKGGEETHALIIAELPAHSHGVSDHGHAHSVYDPPHNHDINQGPHAHGVNDYGHAHSISDPGHAHTFFTGLYTGGGGQYAPGSAYVETTRNTSSVGTGIGIYSSGTGISIGASNANVSNIAAATGIGIYSAGTGISLQNTGSNTPMNVMQPYLTFNKLIKY